MDHSIAFLHTADVHVETFSKLIDKLKPDLTANHLVDESLLEDARQNGITANVKARVERAMSEAAASGATVVVCTCSTIGGIAESLTGQAFQAMRIDRAMANEAVLSGGRILVVAALESTLGITQKLIESSAKRLAKVVSIDMLHIADAWQHFEAGNVDMYHQVIARELEQCWQNYSVIVLAQASMAGAVALCKGVSVPILSSPELGVRVAIEQAMSNK